MSLNLLPPPGTTAEKRGCIFPDYMRRYNIQEAEALVPEEEAAVKPDGGYWEQTMAALISAD